MIQLVSLRGVIPSGKNRVPMKQLQELLQTNGYPNAQTYLYTGNIILTSEKDSNELAEHIYQLILNNIGPDLGILVRTPEAVQQILANNPFQQPEDDLKRVFFSMISHSPTKEAVQVVHEKIKKTDERLIVSEDTAYMYIPGSTARSKLSNITLEKSWKLVAMTHNFNTLSKFLAISENFKQNT
ncbi:MAG TPA: DUF1697 domain-containing protein [Enterococcus sp.]|nr:DUF1697 domain-containing protein [Enterococcus sp.]HPR81851.1 DUF1697 domain-containing protein [Enterococcus sp.]